MSVNDSAGKVNPALKSFSFRGWVFAVAALVGPLCVTVFGARAECPLDWASGFDSADLSDDVLAMTVFDDGTGPALYVGGDFITAGGVVVNRIAKWNGSSWSALGGGMEDTVLALAAFDDGSGAALYAGGQFNTAGGITARGIAKWDGSNWSPLGTGMDHVISTLAVFDDGSGPRLYAGGEFLTAGGVAGNRIARWDGSSWSGLGGGGGNGMNKPVFALTVFDDGSGPALYAGGLFTRAGGLSANSITKWDGSTWSALGSGIGELDTFDFVEALTLFDDGSGPALYAGGCFGRREVTDRSFPVSLAEAVGGPTGTASESVDCRQVALESSATVLDAYLGNLLRWRHGVPAVGLVGVGCVGTQLRRRVTAQVERKDHAIHEEQSGVRNDGRRRLCTRSTPGSG